MAIKLATLEHGVENALKVVLLHAFPFNRFMWRHQVDAIGQKAHVIAVDLPGFGDSPAVFPQGLAGTSLTDYVHATKAFLDERNIQKAVFGGCSWGGYIIFELWKAFPSLVSGFILVDSRMEADTPESSERRKKQIETLRTNGGNTSFLADSMPQSLLSEKTFQRKDFDPHASESVEYCKNTILSTPAQTIINGQTAIMNRANSTDLLPTINVPTLIIVGQDDRATPVQAAQAMNEKLPPATSRLEVIPDAGHLSPLERPVEVNSNILSFLADFKLI